MLPACILVHICHVSDLNLPYFRFHCDFKLTVDPLLIDQLLGQLDGDKKHSASIGNGLKACTPFVLVQSLHACALLSHKPPDALATSLLDHISVRMSELCASDLSCLLWALATLQIDPGWPWVDAALAQCEVQVRGFNNGTMLSSTLWSLAVLQYAPSSTWMEHFSWQVCGGLRLVQE